MLNFTKPELPSFSLPTEIPEIPAEVYQHRQERLLKVLAEQGFDALVIYADREHCANLSWLCGFDPRFEEALWVHLPGQTPTLLVGNENVSFAPAVLKIQAKVELYQQFGLPGQDRSRSNNLKGLLGKAGLAKKMRVALLGWKPMGKPEVPYWIVETLSDITGGLPVNANRLLMDPAQGLRVVQEAEQIRQTEYAAMLTSEAIGSWVMGLREGISEREAANAFAGFGLERSAHPMTNFGRPIPSGLKSPRNATAKRGEYAQGAFGLFGGLTCRAGRLISSSDADADGYLALVENYLKVSRAWYASLRVGAIAGEVFAAAHKAKNDTWEFALNPGHLIHLDEWVHSPFATGSAIPLRSGMAIQHDIIPVPKDSPAVVNMEDGIVLADAELRAELERLNPPLMQRCQTRRQLMERLGYELHPDVLPLSNIAGCFFPFLLEATQVVTLL